MKQQLFVPDRRLNTEPAGERFMITVTGVMIPSWIELNDQPPERMLPKMISGPPIIRVQRPAGDKTVLRTATVERGNGLGFA